MGISLLQCSGRCLLADLQLGPHPKRRAHIGLRPGPLLRYFPERAVFCKQCLRSGLGLDHWPKSSSNMLLHKAAPQLLEMTVSTSIPLVPNVPNTVDGVDTVNLCSEEQSSGQGGRAEVLASLLARRG